MRLVVTGAAGFLGQRLISAILARGSLTNAAGVVTPVTRILAFDKMEAHAFGDSRVLPVTGDIADPGAVACLIDQDTDSVFHLAAVVSGEAERNFDLGLTINVDATRAIMERMRHAAPGAKLMTTSSVAVFGGAMPATVPDSYVWKPQSSYGTQKAINDLLLSDYSRRGYIDGLSLRMPTIVVRPGKPNAAASSFASGIIREPLNGDMAICPVSPKTVLWIMSPEQAILNLLHGHELPRALLGSDRVINMPGLSVTVTEMLQALRSVGGDAAADRVRMEPDPAIEAIVNSWPGNFSAERAHSLGFTHDADMRSIIVAFMRHMGLH
ncbi:SDR family oxidoreductase [Acidisoma cellulosilytica]|uniref:SDR family oxidoreductase n=1 Tax=Acidisoma cellulosilyticum TaxID=2802395 RepID=A0A963Z3L1_9PROT|nr:D-erythronate dehydrogenase [Acidisoma cellulosilyticum]MCB8882235.1 SDR family oxidoreductase [Acidisoma cellulosilyticum]